MKKLRKQLASVEEGMDKTKLKVKEALNLFDPVILYPYRGYGNTKKAIVKGRVLEKESVVPEEGKETESFWQNLYKVFKRYESDEIPHVKIKGVFRGKEVVTASDNDGYFVLEFELDEDELTNGWYSGNVEIIEMPFDLEYEKSAEFEILMCTEACEFGIISDVDDTIIQSHATDTTDKITTILTKNAESRIPFEGVKHLYDHLVGSEKRPLFFVSGSEYNQYDLLVKFCVHQKICKAPFLLRDVGMDSKKWFKKDTEKYKLKNIRELFEFYSQLSFILIGDSGQKDPKIYKTIAEEYPGRVKAIYIRHVDGGKTKRELEQIKNKLNIDLITMDHSEAALKHAVSNGWVDQKKANTRS